MMNFVVKNEKSCVKNEEWCIKTRNGVIKKCCFCSRTERSLDGGAVGRKRRPSEEEEEQIW